jgi:hypothetical protein
LHRRRPAIDGEAAPAGCRQRSANFRRRAPAMTTASAMKIALCMTFLSAVVFLLVIGRLQDRYHTGKPTGWDMSRNAEQLAQLAAKPKAAARYVVPILFPLDLLVLASLAAFMMTGSLYFAADVGIPGRWAWLVLVVPLVYMAADLSENVLLSIILSKGVSEPTVAIAQAMTRLKWVTVTLAGVQTAAIMGVALARSLFHG